MLGEPFEPCHEVVGLHGGHQAIAVEVVQQRSCDMPVVDAAVAGVGGKCAVLDDRVAATSVLSCG